MKKRDPFKPETPQPAEYFINCVKDETVRGYLIEAIKITPPGCVEKAWENMDRFLSNRLYWVATNQGYTFWKAIRDFFRYGSGTKSYADFKHLDKSIK